MSSTPCTPEAPLPGIPLSPPSRLQMTILLNDKEELMQAMIFNACDFIQKTGMEINTNKSISMSAAPQRGNKVNIPATKPVLQIHGRKVPIIDEINAFWYLRHLFGTSGINKPSLNNITFWSESLKGAPLKPDQKLSLARDHLIPKALYGLRNSKVTGTILRNADKIIKGMIKKILHLPVHTHQMRLYTHV